MKPAKYHLPKGKCRECGKLIALRAPTGNYLDATYPRRHKGKDGKLCDGTWSEIDEWIK